MEISIWIKNRKIRSIKTLNSLELKSMTLKETSRYVRVIAILLQLSNGQTSSLLELMSRFTVIWNKSGVLFTIQYAQETFRMVGNFLSGQGVGNDNT
jgi:hypothetical protein